MIFSGEECLLFSDETISQTLDSTAGPPAGTEKQTKSERGTQSFPRRQSGEGCSEIGDMILIGKLVVTEDPARGRKRNSDRGAQVSMTTVKRRVLAISEVATVTVRRRLLVVLI